MKDVIMGNSQNINPLKSKRMIMSNENRTSSIQALMTIILVVSFPMAVAFTTTILHHRPARQCRIVSSLPDMKLTEVDVLYGSRKALWYDASKERYVSQPQITEIGKGSTLDKRMNSGTLNILEKLKCLILPFVARNFIPEGVTPSYYRFVKWRVIQRFINSIVHVLGTQSLLMGLGLKNKALGLSAALNWVLKDALGKLVRLVWASHMGRKFDSDAKRWRFRSSIVFAIGNAMEIVTYVQPQLFLLWATLANCCKQISMLTSSSTRTAIYNSFRTAENIADITAKGEAQIAVVDLLGIAVGVWVSSCIGMKVGNVVGVYLLLQILEIFCLYRMINAVEFRVLNFERLSQLITNFVNSMKKKDPIELPTPTEMAATERIFLPPENLGRRAIAFGSLSRARLSPDELKELLNIFQNERYFLVVGEDVKNRKIFSRKRTTQQNLEENCHIVLHSDATNVDIVKATLALTILRQSLQSREKSQELPRSRDCWEEIQTAASLSNEWFPLILRFMSKKGWARPAKFMFGRVTMRAQWPLLGSSNTTSVTTIENSTNSINKK